MTEIYETQSERTDLPLVVMPSVLDSMIEPIKAQFPALHDVARVRMFEEFTSDEATIAERLKDADALLVGGYHISDDQRAGARQVHRVLRYRRRQLPQSR